MSPQEKFSLAAMGTPAVVLRAIEARDLDDLRAWKNHHRATFLFKGEITAEEQLKWFQGYLLRPNDMRFIVHAGPVRAGSLGFRIIDAAADCYAVMTAPNWEGADIMGKGMAVLCSYIRAEHAKKIGCKVLKDNPGLNWYLSCGFRVAAERTDYYQLKLDDSRAPQCGYEKKQ